MCAAGEERLVGMCSQPIGVFDSGLGGLTVARAIATALPHESVCYVGDTARCPYGVRTPEEVRSFVMQVGAWLEARGAKIIVIACNTATAAGLRAAQRAFDVPVIGVIAPGARAAMHWTRARKVGVLATPLTIDSDAYTRAIHELDAGVEVTGCAAPRFVEAVEGVLARPELPRKDWLGAGGAFMTEEVLDVVHADAAPLLGRGIDTVVLGCTHFPLLVQPIREVLGEGVHVVSSAEETALELEDILLRRGQLAPADARPRHTFATTSDDLATFARAGGYIFGRDLEHVEHVDLAELVGLRETE